MKTIKNMNLARTSYTETLNELMYAMIYCSGRDHDEEELQQEKDKFAVEFAEWCSVNGWKYSVSTLKLLDIYKEELANNTTTKEKEA